eukprot:10555811-Alexandrium_andersonii.AAC.1
MGEDLEALGLRPVHRDKGTEVEHVLDLRLAPVLHELVVQDLPIRVVDGGRLVHGVLLLHVVDRRRHQAHLLRVDCGSAIALLPLWMLDVHLHRRGRRGRGSGLRNLGLQKHGNGGRRSVDSSVAAVVVVIVVVARAAWWWRRKRGAWSWRTVSRLRAVALHRVPVGPG